MSELRQVWTIKVDSGQMFGTSDSDYDHEPTEEEILEFCERIDIDHGSIVISKRYIYKNQTK